MTADPGSFLTVAMNAATMAREIITASRPATVTEKSDRDLVSDVDVRVERTIRGYLQDATPGIAFLGEEEGQTGDPDASWRWTLDPVDGTSNFTHGLPLCATSLVLVRDGRPVVAVIDAPFLDQRYHAIEGHGAYSGDRPLKASSTTRLRDAIVAIGDYAVGPSADRKNELRLAATVQLTPRVHRIRMLGTAALDLAWVADGRLDASITLANNPWDTLAGVLIAREAGATVVDTDGSPHNLHSTATIAAPASLIDQIIPLIQDAGYSRQTQDSQVGYTSPYAALDHILSSARNLIFEFDGPICDLSSAMPATTASQLAATLQAEAASQLPATGTTDDPIDVLARAAAISPDLAARIDSQLTGIEKTVVNKAIPAAYAHETLAACRDSGRHATIISRHSARALDAYLTSHGLADQIRTVVASADYPPGHLQTIEQLLEDAIRALGSTPDDCALITASPAGISAARSTGTQTIGYAATPGTTETLTTAGVECTVTSLADLTLRLRARPLPN
jgi:myo-inositol-1(or 4)-monophosphatase